MRADAEYTCVHVSDRNGAILFPSARIADECSNGDDVTVQLLGPDLALVSSALCLSVVVVFKYSTP
jgi:hypothetical protein